MDRFFGAKVRLNDDETSKPRHKKATKRKHSSSDEKRNRPTSQLPFSLHNHGKESSLPFKILENKNLKASFPTSRQLSKSNSRKHKLRDSEFKKIVGAICGDDSTKKRKSHSRMKQQTDSSCSGSSVDDPPPHFAERRSLQGAKKQKNEKEEYQRRYDKEDHYVEFQQRNDKDYYQEKIKNQRPRIRKKLTFSSSESDSEKESTRHSKADPFSKGFDSPVLGYFSGNEKADLKMSPDIVAVDKKEIIKSPVPSKSRHSDQDLLSDYINFATEITDELTIERQKFCPGKSYLEMVSQNLLSVFKGGGSKKEKQDKELCSKQNTLEGFVTPLLKVVENNERRQNRDLRITSPITQHFTQEMVGESPKFVGVRRTQSASSEGLFDKIFSRHDPFSSPASEDLQPGHFAGSQCVDFGKFHEEPTPNFPNLILSPGVDEPAMEVRDAANYIQNIFEPKRDKIAAYDDPQAAVSFNTTFSKELCLERKVSERVHQSSLSPLFHFHRNEYVEPRERARYQHGKEVPIMRRLSGVSCTATSQRPTDYNILDNSFVLPEARFDVRDCHDHFQSTGSHRELPEVYSEADALFTAHSSDQNLLKNSAECLQKRKLVETKLKDWYNSPKYYKRRMF